MNWYEQIDPRYLNKENARKLEYFNSLMVRPYAETFYPDILINPFFMVTKGVAEVLSYFDSSVDYKVAALFDLENKVGKTYFIPILEQIDCLAEGTEFNLDHSVIHRAVIDPNRTLGKALFKLAAVKNTYIVARLDFVECVLRRKALGVKLKEIEIL
jgi:hypothetical protein